MPRHFVPDFERDFCLRAGRGDGTSLRKGPVAAPWLGPLHTSADYTCGLDAIEHPDSGAAAVHPRILSNAGPLPAQRLEQRRRAVHDTGQSH